MGVKPSSEVNWHLVIDGEIEFTAETVLECVEKKDEQQSGRVVSMGSKTS